MLGKGLLYQRRRYDVQMKQIHEDIERLRKEEGIIEEMMEERKEGNEEGMMVYFIR